MQKERNTFDTKSEIQNFWVPQTVQPHETTKKSIDFKLALLKYMAYDNIHNKKFGQKTLSLVSCT